jgi:CHAT domain-containing protein/Tfp pilus assembly protein PilF
MSAIHATGPIGPLGYRVRQARFCLAGRLIVMGCAVFLGASVALADPTMLQYEHQLTELLHQGRYQDAESVGRTMLDYALRQFGQGSDMHSAALTDLSAVYFEWGRFKDAERMAKDSIAIFEARWGPHNLVLSDALNNLASCFNKQCRYGEAIRMHQRALAIRQANWGAESPQVAMSLENMALGYVGLGQYAEAEALYAKARAIHVKNHGWRHRTVGINLCNTGLLYMQLGRRDEAESFLKEAVALSEEIGNPKKVATCLESLGTICTLRHRYDEAEKYHLQARENIAAAMGAESPFVDALDGLGHLYFAQDRLDEAEAVFRRALVADEQIYGAKSTELAQDLVDIGRVLSIRKQYSEAETLYDLALSITEAAEGSHSDRAEIRYLRGLAAWNAGHREKGQADFEAGMRLADEERASFIGGAHERSESYGVLQDRFIVPAQYYLDDGQFDAGFQALERGRNRSLLEQMASAHVNLLEGLPAEQRQALEQAEQQAYAEIASIERQLEVLPLREDLDESGRKQELQRLRSALAVARHQAVEAYSAIRTASPKFRDIVGQQLKPIDLPHLQSWLGERSAIALYYSISKYGVHVLSVGGPDDMPRDEKIVVNDQQAQSLGLAAGELTAYDAQTMLANESGDGVLQLLSKPEKATTATDKLAALWSLLVPEPIRARLLDGSVKQLVIVPDGPLAQLPFEALVTKAGAAPEYLVDVGPPIQYAPSATILLNLATRPAGEVPANREPVLAVGDPAYAAEPAGATSARYGGLGGQLARLPYSGQEAIWVTEVFGKQGVKAAILKGKLATERMVRGNVAGRRIVHLACHGLADQSYGNFFGALALAPDTGGAADDGFLSLPEIYQLDLRTCDLSILSACQTNYGPNQQGEGVWSLSRGFLVAGARRVVASNWLVDDEAAASLVSYYCAQLAKQEHDGLTPDYARALCEAKRWVRKQAKWQSPYYWSTFVLIGPG